MCYCTPETGFAVAGKAWGIGTGGKALRRVIGLGPLTGSESQGSAIEHDAADEAES